MLPELFIGAAVLAFGCQLAVLYAVIVGRAPASSTRRSARWVEVAWVVLPTVVLLAVLVATWNRIERPTVTAPTAGVRA